MWVYEYNFYGDPKFGGEWIWKIKDFH
jgi:hypothetical protein